MQCAGYIFMVLPYPLRKVIWAVDPFDSSTELQAKSAELLKAISQQVGMRIEPVYILSESLLEKEGFELQPWMEQYRTASEKALAKILTTTGLKNIARTHVLLQRTSLLKEAVDILISYADEVQADLLVVGTHGRSGISRLLLGSFAETLLFRTHIPILTIGEETHVVSRLNKILFPTDFGIHAKQTFRTAISIAKALNAEVILYHAVPHPVEPILQSGVSLLGGSWVPVQAYFSNEAQRKTRRAKSWANWATHQGVKTEVKIDLDAGMIGDSIIALGKEAGVSLILMEEEMGRMAARVIGSITQYVIRHSPCPVFVLRNVSNSKMGFPPWEDQSLSIKSA